MVHFVEQCFDSPSLISDKCCHLTLYLSQMEPYCERIILAAWSFEQRWSGNCFISYWNSDCFSAPKLCLIIFFVHGPLVSCRPCPPGDPIAWHWASLQFHDPSRIKETQLINKSLMSLKDCIRNRALSALNIGELVNFPFLDFNTKNPLSGSLLVTVWNFDRCRTLYGFDRCYNEIKRAGKVACMSLLLQFSSLEHDEKSDLAAWSVN